MIEIPESLKLTFLVLFAQFIGVIIWWLKIKNKRSDTDAERDAIEVRQGLIALEAYETLKKEHELLATLLPKLESKLDKLKEQVQALEGVERDRDIAQSQVRLIETIASNLTVKMTIANNKDGE